MILANMPVFYKQKGCDVWKRWDLTFSSKAGSLMGKTVTPPPRPNMAWSMWQRMARRNKCLQVPRPVFQIIQRAEGLRFTTAAPALPHDMRSAAKTPDPHLLSHGEPTCGAATCLENTLLMWTCHRLTETVTSHRAKQCNKSYFSTFSFYRIDQIKISCGSMFIVWGIFQKSNIRPCMCPRPLCLLWFTRAAHIACFFVDWSVLYGTQWTDLEHARKGRLTRHSWD